MVSPAVIGIVLAMGPLLETVPLYVLFELGVVLAGASERRARARAGAGAVAEPSRVTE